MSNFIEHISIRNFKSIREFQLSGCKRINLFIGKPNVGKSNIIEALSLFSVPYLRENSTRKLTHLIRLENEAELFYNGSIEMDASISTNQGNCRLGYNPKEGLKVIIEFFSDSYHVSVDEKLNVKGLTNHPYFEPPIKKYSYKHDITYRKSHSKYLIPPFGYNLLSIIEHYPDLKSQVVELFKEYGLEIAFDKATQTIKVIQENTKEGLFLIPYNSIADTLQRIIFFKAAIASNNNSILLFEEPEAHSFPPYMSHITQEIIRKTDNQYFIATHSPYILNNLLENKRDELSVYMVDYKDKQTVINHLSDDTLHEILQYGVDLFTNSESYGFSSNS
ncbi:MAG: ATPase [Chitinophagaceae bacterium]|nr:MAG: ATPase [Chitinophagaceae bacterium]